WASYDLRNFLLFSRETYLRLFELYNDFVGPGWIVAVLAGLGIPLAFAFGGKWRGRIASAILAAAWLWIAWGFHWRWYRGIHLAAPWFAGAFAVQGVLLGWVGGVRDRLRTDSAHPVSRWAGWTVYGFALAGYPLFTPIWNRPWTQAELFALAPDPTAIGTLALLLLAARRLFRALWIIPLLWLLNSALTLWAMGSVEAWAPITAGGIAILGGVWRGTMGREGFANSEKGEPP
ncbi:MAG: DUF6064 family protein, partial [Desulfococcaceae bacterium]